jgi:1,4-alpha-glucan branching enzyme
MGWFSGALADVGAGRVVYHESHDEAGNSSYVEGGERVYSARTIAVAVNNAVLIGDTRRYAEARARVAAGLTLMAPGTVMFFMGEEVGAWEPYRFDDFLQHRQDLPALRAGVGANLFRFYQDLIAARQSRPSVRSRNIDILYTHDANRVLAFRRWQGAEEVIVVASLNNASFGAYRIQHASIGAAVWREVLNSDDQRYGGSGHLNATPIDSTGGAISPQLPANSIVVLQRQ